MNFAGIMVILEIDNFFGQPYALHMKPVIGETPIIERVNLNYLTTEIHRRANFLMFF